ncbi:sensor histidine kinase [Actinomadura rupiterrae]|uniref:sensor histidine kinase n=1 Tax=Actinomadura rupiterrae TaxID=559627 RepID=UPI0020A456AC|nr:histidine kinase [Actinomadura rupiterrae]MCP2341947.1 signal transduction histidine kinase [Actinomadura rupiterrae]
MNASGGATSAPGGGAPDGGGPGGLGPGPRPDARQDAKDGLARVQSVGGCLFRLMAWGCAALYLMLCLAVSYSNGSPWDLATVVVAAIVAYACLARRRLEQWAAVSAGSSLLLTWMLAAVHTGVRDQAALVEVTGLLVLVARMVWTAPQNRLVGMTTLVAVPVVVVPLRGSEMMLVFFAGPLAVLVAIAIGTGLYLRALDERRVRALSDARRDERLELARDLHDFVAHHVTGIVVQAQAARFAASSGAAAQSPEQLDRMFGQIEKAGTEALTSMRRMVGLLRDAQEPGRGPEPGATRPVGDLTQIADLVDGFGDTPPAALALADDLGELPPEVVTSVHRVVQEALTNARKHAADATVVRVSVARLGDGSVEVAVRDDGQGRGRRLPSGGFGLAGLAERVDAIGGRLYAGPRPEGGWEVVAVIPVVES